MRKNSMYLQYFLVIYISLYYSNVLIINRESIEIVIKKSILLNIYIILYQTGKGDKTIDTTFDKTYYISNVYS